MIIVKKNKYNHNKEIYNILMSIRHKIRKDDKFKKII
mgnify:CR=1 FL=1